MSIYRIQKTDAFSVISNAILNDDRLTWKARGLMAYMLSKPNDWVFYWEELVTHSPEGMTSLKSGLKELKKYGYLSRNPIKDEKGKIIEWETVVREFPNIENPLDGNLPSGFPLDGSPSTGKRTTTNTKELNTEKQITKSNKKLTLYAEFVSMTKEEYQKLIDQFGESDTKDMIEILDNYKGATGKKYKSDYRACLNWVKDRVQENKFTKNKKRSIFDQGEESKKRQAETYTPKHDNYDDLPF